ncbi:MAG: cellulose binding domain-containing protein, partial [Solirubrobacteraceae bacterium]
MLACALLVAALAVQPAAGDSGSADTPARAAAVAQDLGSARALAPAAPATPVTSTSAPPSPPSTG